MEVTGKTSLLSRDQRNLLMLVDGKATVGDLQHKSGKSSESKLHLALAALIRDGFVREFVSAPHSVSPPSQFYTRHDLDFTEIGSPDKATEEALQAAEAAEIASAMRAKAASEDRAAAASAPDPRREAIARAKREAEEGARREAEAQARREAEEKARREAEEKARREAEAQARREAEEKARREAEAKAKREAEEQARRQAEAQARREAEEKARREAEAKAKREAEEKARREAEAKAKREAEEQARREAEARAKREAEEKARREAEEKARREAEEKARREAEAKAKREAEEQARREAEAQARREAEEQARREAEENARREAEEKARREAEAAARKEAEAARRAEEKARREAEARERKEAKARAKAQAAEIARLEAEAKAQRRAAAKAEKARRNWEEKADQQQLEQMQRAAEEEQARAAEREAKQRRLEEERSRAREEAERAAQERREQRAREKAEADARVAARKRERERERAAIGARLRRIRGNKTGGVKKWLSTGAVLLLAAGALGAPYWPVDPTPYERMASDTLGVPVKIGKASFAWSPWPAMKFAGVTLGAQDETRVERLLAVPTLWTLLSERPDVRQLRLDGVALEPDALPMVLAHKFDVAIPALKQIELHGVRLDTPGASLPVLHGRIDLAGGKLPGTVQLQDEAGQFRLQFVPQGSGSGSFELQLADAAAIAGFPLTDFYAKGTFTAAQADIAAFDGHLYDGLMKGQGVLTWSPLSFNGTLEANLLTSVKIAPVLEGRLRASGTFAMAAETFDALFAAPTLQGSFEVAQGVIHGLDLPRSLQAGEAAAGSTAFEELSGRLELKAGHLRLSDLNLRAGVMTASGRADLAGGKQLDGHIAAQLRIPAGYARASFAIGGTPQAVTVKR